MAAKFKPAYLITATTTVDSASGARDCGRWRSPRRSQGTEVFEGDAAAVEKMAAALSAMTFAIGRRFMIVDGVSAGRPPT